MGSKVKEFAAKENLRAVGRSKGYIFKHDLLTEAGVKPTDEFRVLVTARKIIFEYPEPEKLSPIVPRPLSCYLKKRVAEKASARADEIWPDDAPRGKERLG
jgi:hypothetical protein